MRAIVYHARELWDTHGPRPTWPGDHVAVACVEAAVPGQAYGLTQTVDRPWWENQAVEPVFDGPGCRSTSAGDVIVIGDTAWFCELSGWTALPDPEIAFTLEGLRGEVITPREAADRIEALLGLGMTGSRPSGEAQVRLRCDFYVPGPGLCGWEGTASEAGWCTYYDEYICPRCGSSDGLRIVLDDTGADLTAGPPASPRFHEGKQPAQWPPCTATRRGAGVPLYGEGTYTVHCTRRQPFDRLRTGSTGAGPARTTTRTWSSRSTRSPAWTRTAAG